MLLRSSTIAIVIMLLSGALYAMPGGYSNVSVTDPQVQNVANFAATTINNGKLARIVSAESQVVAGVNYKLILEVVDQSGALHNYKVIVFVPLPSSNQAMQVTNVAEIVGD
jgi:TPP-dependent indolepyruvate ferredoxin oxidoreductase alpha subunit